MLLRRDTAPLTLNFPWMPQASLASLVSQITRLLYLLYSRPLVTCVGGALGENLRSLLNVPEARRESAGRERSGYFSLLFLPVSVGALSFFHTPRARPQPSLYFPIKCFHTFSYFFLSLAAIRRHAIFPRFRLLYSQSFLPLPRFLSFPPSFSTPTLPFSRVPTCFSEFRLLPLCSLPLFSRFPSLVLLHNCRLFKK